MHRKTDPAIEWLSQLVAPLSPEEFLSKQAASLLAKSGQSEPPFNPQKALPPTVKRVEFAKLSRDGMLIPVQGGFIIKINSLKPLVRQNFTCAHEIGHTFFYDVTGERPWRPYKSMSTYWGEEGLCHAFARELLMPTEFVERDLEEHKNRDLEFILTLANKYKVSVEVAARRLMLDLSEYDKTVLIFAETGGKGKNTDRSIWWYHGKTLRRYLRKDEDAIFRQVLSVISDQPSKEILKATAKLWPSEATLQWYESRPDSRFMFLLSFCR